MKENNSFVGFWNFTKTEETTWSGSMRPSMAKDNGSCCAHPAPTWQRSGLLATTVTRGAKALASSNHPHEKK
eukprot:5236408-Amphidinium_carterae.1